MTKNCNTCNSNSLSINHYSEDFATITEIYCSNCNKIIDKEYIGSTDWSINPEDSKEKLECFIRKWEK